MEIQVGDLHGYSFKSGNLRNQFNEEFEKFKLSLPNSPDDFDDRDREMAREFVDKLVISYVQSGSLVK